MAETQRKLFSFGISADSQLIRELLSRHAGIATPEPFRQQIPNFVSRAKEVLRRKDLRELTVTFRIGDGETLEFHEQEQMR